MCVKIAENLQRVVNISLRLAVTTKMFVKVLSARVGDDDDDDHDEDDGNDDDEEKERRTASAVLLIVFVAVISILIL